MNKKDSSKPIEFKGFYLSNGINWLVRGNFVAYILITFLLSAIPAIGFTLLGLEPFFYVSILVYSALFLFLNLVRWASNFGQSFLKKVKTKAKANTENDLSEHINKRLNAIFNIWGHIASGIIVLLLVFLGVLVLNHLEWLLIPSILILSFFTGMTFWIIFQVFYFWHSFATEVIGEKCLFDPLDQDRMGGFKFVAESLVAFSAMEIIMAGFAISILLTFSWEVQLITTVTPSLAIIAIVLGITIGGYVFIVFELHKKFNKEKQNQLTKYQLLPEDIKSELFSITDDSTKPSSPETIHATISPHANEILAVKSIADEIRSMRDWPINIPMVLQIVGSTIVSIFVIFFRLIILITFGIALP